MKCSLRWMLSIGIIFLLSGCETMQYYAQAAHGHLQLMAASRPIDDWLQDPQTPEALKAKLTFAKAARDYASNALGLPENDSYRRYADLGRNYVVANVFAAPRLSLQLKSWCYPVVGCAVYRGYFSGEAAKDKAAQLSEQGLDTYVAPIPAYSTLGYFPDPLLNTFIDRPKDQLAALIFHELTHQLIYVQGDSEFNESLANAVEELGLEQFKTTDSYQRLMDSQPNDAVQIDAIHALIEKTRLTLSNLYANPQISDEDKIEQKKELIDAFEQSYRRQLNMTATQSNAWLTKTGNAHFGSFATYHQLVPEFKRLFAACDHRFESFYAVVKQLTQIAQPEERRQWLKQPTLTCKVK